MPVALDPGNLLVPGKLPGDGVFNSIVVPPPGKYKFFFSIYFEKAIENKVQLFMIRYIF